MRQKIVVYVDYALRTPSFTAAYNALKQYMFETIEEEFEVEASTEEGAFVLRDYWRDEVKVPEIRTFYENSTLNVDDYDNKQWHKYFYNEKHYKKFLEDYSFNLYVDAEVCCKKDIEMLNIGQKHLFDVVLVDEYQTERKKANTLFFLSKIRISPYSIVFIPEGEKLNEDEFLGVWNPKQNSEQENRDGLGGFEIWLMELEQKVRNGKASQ